MKKQRIPWREFFGLILGEIIVSALIVLAFIIINTFMEKDFNLLYVSLGAILGSVVTVANFIVLSITTGRAFDKAMEARGTGEMSEEEIEKFTRDQQASIAAAAKLAYIIRTILMAATLVVAFISGIFNVVATLIPLAAFRPILMIDAMIKDKKERS